MKINFFNSSKHLKIIILVGVLLFTSNLQAQYWMQKAGGVTIDEAADVAVDGLNNAYSVGYFTGFSGFGATFLNSSGSTDIYISKTNSSGNFVWAKKAGGASSDKAEAVAIDNLGNVYVTGFFTGSANFGSISLTSNGLRDIFISKYNAAGTIQWAVNAGGSGSDVGFGIDVNSVGEIFITGSFNGLATFGSSSLTSNNATSDVFVAKLNTNGVFQWAQSGTSTLANVGVSLGTDNVGNVYVSGQFSDTITFDQVHTNQSQNIIFLVKFDSLGVEKWFTTISSTLTNSVYDIAVDTVGNCYMTGDFQGILEVYNITTGVSSSLSSPYSHTAFVIRYDSTGLWNMKKAIGSNNFVSSRSIAVDTSGDFYIGGQFECDLTEYTAIYGMANLLAVGQKDVFVSKYASTGTWLYARNMGGKADDLCFGIAVNAVGNVYASGSFSSSLHIPVSTNFNSTNLSFWASNNCITNTGFCNAVDYGRYKTMISQGNKDLFVVNAFDPNRDPYDFFIRSGTGCVKDYAPICIANCMDTLVACKDTTISVSTGMCDGIGPEMAFSWSTGAIVNSISVIATGWYSVTVTPENGCFILTDSIYVEIYPIPDVPHITDGKGFNVDSIITVAVQLCSPDTTVLTGGGFGATDTYWWTGPGLGAGVYDSTVVVSLTGTYFFYVRSINGCVEANSVLVKENLPFPLFDLEMSVDDSVEVCFPDAFTVQLYDSISNSSAAVNCLSTNVYTVFSTWNSVPTLSYLTFCDTYGYFDADSSGTYTIYDTTVRFNYCYRDTFTTSKSVYVTVNPKPIVAPFPLYVTGNPTLCPGGSTVITANGGPNYRWFGLGVNGNTDSVITVTSPGTYIVESTKYDTNSYGCVGEFSITNRMNVVLKSQPIASGNPLVICPGGTVTLSSSSNVGNAWEGPNGPILGGQIITVTDPGQYFTVVNDADSCGLVSNTVTLQQYTTPSLMPSGDTLICPGQSTIIFVQANTGSIVTWDAPLTGTGFSQVISTPGTYSCSITSCGIVTSASITISQGNPLAQISPVGVLCKDSVQVLQGPPGMASYTWLPSNDTTQNISINNAGTYTLSIVDQNGCAGTSAPFIVTKVEPNVGLLNTTLGYCFGDSIVLQADDTALANYLWSPGGEITSQIAVFNPGTYSLMVTDSNGCVADGDPFYVNQSDTIANIIQVGDSVVCERDTVWLNPVITGYSSYVWMPGMIQVTSLPITETGVYSLVATDSLGCAIASDSFDIIVLDAPISGVGANGVLCEDSSLVLNGIPNRTSYNWMPGNFSTSDITVSSPGTYTLVVSDSNGCQSLGYPFLVDEIRVPIAITNPDLGFCEGDSLLLTANSGMAHYLWTPSGDTTRTTQIIETGVISLSVVDTNGCMANLGPVEVTQSNSLIQFSSTGNSIICAGDTVVLTANNPNFTSYNWMPGNINSNSITVSQSGNYWMSATDSVGCVSNSDTAQVVVVENDLNAPIIAVDSLVCEGARVLIIGDAGSDTIYWYTNFGGSPIYVGDTLVRTINGSTTFFAQTVSVPCASEFVAVDLYTDDCDKVTPSNVFTPNGDGVNDQWSLAILGATCYEVEIYNRWGILISTLTASGAYWDGTIDQSSLDAADGTYYFILKYCDYKNERFSQTGYITLIR